MVFLSLAGEGVEKEGTWQRLRKPTMKIILWVKEMNQVNTAFQRAKTVNIKPTFPITTNGEHEGMYKVMELFCIPMLVIQIYAKFIEL